ncbi:MAG TPA: type II secretion system F family protein [Chlamydiales bacterium]|nr:type II secretion system F family protein [Chlamydiales bacterium]
MALFQYVALNEKGKKIFGSIQADSLSDAKQKLVRRQTIVLTVDPLSEKQLRTVLSKKDLLTLTSEIARLLQAGLPLYEALAALEEKYRGQKTHKLLLDLCDKVLSGQSFSQAISQHRDCFDLLFISMVANAEKTGRLGVALDEISNLLDRQIKVRKQIVSALIYPALLSGFCCVILSALLFFVVPSLKELFEGRDLHPFSKLVFACSHFACQAKSELFVFLIAIAGMTGFCLSTAKRRQKLISIMSCIPLIRSFLAKIAFVRFCRATATLLEGGIPAMTAFAQARTVMRHPVLEAVIAKAEEKISEGEPLHVPFQNHPLIPPLVPRMIAIATQAGKLPFMMSQISQIYEDELETHLTRFATLAQPILLLILGGIVGFVLLAVLLPLTDVSSFVN